MKRRNGKPNGKAIIKLDAGDLIQGANGTLRKADRNDLNTYIIEFTTAMMMRTRDSVTPKQIAVMQFGSSADDMHERLVRHHGWRSYRAAQDEGVPVYPAYSNTQGGKIVCYKKFTGDDFDMEHLPRYIDKCKHKLQDAGKRWRIIQSLFLK